MQIRKTSMPPCPSRVSLANFSGFKNWLLPCAIAKLSVVATVSMWATSTANCSTDESANQDNRALRQENVLP